MRQLAASAARDALTLFRAHEAQGLYHVIPVGHAHYVEARRWMEMLEVPLRALDALHLAIAHGEGLSFMTADRGLARAGRTLGVPTRLIS